MFSKINLFLVLTINLERVLLRENYFAKLQSKKKENSTYCLKRISILETCHILLTTVYSLFPVRKCV